MPSDAHVTGTLPAAPADGLHAAAPEDGSRPAPAAWLEQAREALAEPGRFLAYEQDGRRIVVALDKAWTRIGRSLGADVRFDDATVSRRHALVACDEQGVRVLDDRSLNGIVVNGRRVEWSPLADGDVITVGRHTLHYVDTAGSAAAPAPVPQVLAE